MSIAIKIRKKELYNDPLSLNINNDSIWYWLSNLDFDFQKEEWISFKYQQEQEKALVFSNEFFVKQFIDFLKHANPNLEFRAIDLNSIKQIGLHLKSGVKKILKTTIIEKENLVSTNTQSFESDKSSYDEIKNAFNETNQINNFELMNLLKEIIQNQTEQQKSITKLELITLETSKILAKNLTVPIEETSSIKNQVDLAISQFNHKHSEKIFDNNEIFVEQKIEVKNDKYSKLDLIFEKIKKGHQINDLIIDIDELEKRI